jgi:hypothetical protein
MTDKQLADAVHKKFYPGMPWETFYKAVGLDLKPWETDESCAPYTWKTTAEKTRIRLKPPKGSHCED